MLSSADVALIEKRLKPSVLEANKVLLTARELAAACHGFANETDIEAGLGKLDLRVVCRVHNKDIGTPFKSYAAIGCELYDALQQCVSGHMPVVCPWQRNDAAASTKEAESAAMRQLAVGGRRLTFESFKKELGRKQIEVGSRVRKIHEDSSKADFEVLAITETGTTIKLVDTQEEPRTIENMSFLDGYQMKKVERIVIKDIAEFGNAMESKLWVTMQLKALAGHAMEAAWKRFYSKMKVKVQLSPRTVIATKAFSAGELTLLAVSANIIVADEKQKLPPGALKLEYQVVEGTAPELKVAISPSINLDVEKTHVFAVPYFCVKRSADYAGANLVYGHIEQKVAVNGRTLMCWIPCFTNDRDVVRDGEVAVYAKATMSDAVTDADQAKKRARKG